MKKIFGEKKKRPFWPCQATQPNPSQPDNDDDLFPQLFAPSPTLPGQSLAQGFSTSTARTRGVVFEGTRKKSPLSGKVSGQKNQPAGFERIDLFTAKSMSFKKCQVKYAKNVR